MGKKIEIIPYLAFKGDCEAALDTYMKAFGGRIDFMSRWSENTFDVTPDQVGKVMHAEFVLGNSHMAGGDTFDCAEVNTDVRLMVHMESKEEALNAVSVLSEGGKIISPLQPHPKPDDGGCGCVLKDPFGFTWIITCPNPAKQ